MKYRVLLLTTPLLALAPACSDDGPSSDASTETAGDGDGDPSGDGDGDPTGDGDPSGDGDGDPTGDGDPSGDGDGDPTGDGDGDMPPESCDGIGSSNLDGACIHFAEPGATWTLDEVAAGIEVPYWVIVEAEIPDVVVLGQSSCWEPGPSGFAVFEYLAGGDHHYCRCDVGICPAPDPVPTSIPAGMTQGLFEWTGTNWNGPSDTGEPLGEPFPAGVYTLEVSVIGTVDGQDFEVSNTFEITLEP